MIKHGAHWPEAEYLVCAPLALVVATVPKCGCSTLAHWVSRVHGVEPPPTMSRGYAVATYGLKNYRAAERIRIQHRYRAIGFVRDPLERLASAFVNKFAYTLQHEGARQCVREVYAARDASPNYRRGITFREFAALVSQRQPPALDPHWRPQYAFFRWPDMELYRLSAMDSVLEKVAPGTPRPRVYPTPEPTAYDPAAHGCFADVPSGELGRLDKYPTWPLYYDAKLRHRLAPVYALDALLYAGARKG